MRSLSFNKLLLNAIFVLIFSLLFTPSALSMSFEQICNPPQTLFGKVRAAFQQVDLRRTVTNMATSMLTDVGFQWSTGVELTQFVGCTEHIVNTAGISPGEGAPVCSGTAGTVCDSLINNFGDVSIDPQAASNFRDGQAAGSLLGLAYTLENSVNYEPVPVNLALYWNDSIAKVPFAGRALATEVNYRGWFLQDILNLWKIIRNLSYALVAIVMLVVGFMIMTKKKISPQAAVTVQYAIPKIIIALVLITFSYPIGAVMATLAFVLRGDVTHLINTMYIAAGGPTAGVVVILADLGIAAQIILAMVIALATGGVGSIFLIIILIGVVIPIILYLIIQLKILLLYIKMLINIITAPITFVVGAVPGNENATTNWFKQMASYGLSIIGMAAAVRFIHLAGGIIIASQFEQGGANVIWGIALLLLAPVAIFIFGYYFALKVPGTVDRWIMGDKKR
jgi:hypothetical protein